MLVRDGGDGADVDEAERRVAGGFDPDELCFVGSDQLADFDLDGGGEGDVDAVRGGDFCEVPVCAAVDIGYGDNVGARGEGLEDRGCRCGAGGEGEGIAGVF